ncbi:MAG: type II toxin-antitoxin system prevent-host-death family antitoxin [Proteobacteria bacterium]|nr:type II toxin-antitoxin system prevent-host-death family antitoxin [Pseudomonadota bacterium]
MLISEFKARCIQMLKEVQRSRTPLTVTLRGRPMVTIQPCAEAEHRPQLGTLRGSVEIRGDIVHGAWDDDWEEP